MQVTWSPQAVVHLVMAFELAAANNLAAAKRQDRAIVGTVARLGDFPHLGRPGRTAGRRELVIPETPYIAAYSVMNGVIGVIALLHGAKRWSAQF